MLNFILGKEEETKHSELPDPVEAMKA
jgi:hypothetical protein